MQQAVDQPRHVSVRLCDPDIGGVDCVMCLFVVTTSVARSLAIEGSP